MPKVQSKGILAEDLTELHESLKAAGIPVESINSRGEIVLSTDATKEQQNEAKRLALRFTPTKRLSPSEQQKFDAWKEKHLLKLWEAEGKP